MISTHLKNIVFLLLYLSVSSSAFSQSLSSRSSYDLEPIIPLETKYSANSLGRYLIQYYTDDIKQILDKSDFQSSEKKYQSLRQKDSSDFNQQQKIDHSYQLLYLALSLKYFLDEKGAVGFANIAKHTNLSSQSFRSLMKSLSKDIYTHCSFIIKAKATSEKAILHFYRYSNGPLSSNSLTKLSLILKDKKAPIAIKQRTYFALLYFSLRDPDQISSIAQINALKKKYFAKARSLSSTANVALSLALASAYAGLAKGQLIRDSIDNQFQTHLQFAAKRITTLHEDLREMLIDQVIHIWNHDLSSKNQPANYLSMPLSLSSLANTKYYYPLEERHALSQLKKFNGSNKWKVVYRKYLTIDQLNQYYPYFMQRLIEQTHKKYQETKNYRELEQEIIWQFKYLKEQQIIYQSPVSNQDASLEQDNFQQSQSQSPPQQHTAVSIALQQHAQVIYNLYLEIITHQRTIANSSRSSAEQKKSYLALVNRFIAQTNPGINQTIQLKESQANVLTKLKLYSQAVKTYFEASNLSTASQEKIRLLDLAIKTQSILVPWPTNPPVSSKRPIIKSQSAANNLLKFYQRKIIILNSITQQSFIDDQGWESIAHITMLNIYLKNEIKAANLIHNSIKQSPNHSLVSRLSEVALSIYLKHKQWEALEQLSIFVLDNGVAAIYPNNSPVNVNSMLELALSLGGRKLLLNKQFKLAASKLTHYIKRYPNGRHINSVRFDLARSYWGDQQHNLALNEIQKVVLSLNIEKLFPDYKKALALAIIWAQQLAIEDAILQLSIKYIKQFPKDRFSFNLASIIYNLLLAQDRYSDLIFCLNFIKKSKFSSPTNNKLIDLELISAALLQAEHKNILNITNQIIAQSSDQLIKARAYIAKADVYFQQNDKNKLLLLDKEIEKLNKTILEVREARAYVKLMLLKTVDQSNSFGEVQDIALANPQKFLEDRYKSFVTLYQRYSDVCNIGSTSSCVDSMNLVLTIAKRFKQSSNNVQISKSLSLPAQKKFETYKASLLSKIDDLINRSQALANKASSYHGSTPQSVLDNLWISEKDWNFDPLSYGQGKGFLFWKMQTLN